MMTVSHSFSRIESQKGKEKLDKEKKNEEIEISATKIEDKEVSPILDEEVENGLLTPPLLSKLEARANLSARLREGKELAKEKIEAQLIVQTTKAQEEFAFNTT